MVDYVLGKFSGDEYQKVSKVIGLAVSAAKELISGDIRKVMTAYNGTEVD
jgi:PTH1 family peptidyl-tRNA hydrolase